MNEYLMMLEKIYDKLSCRDDIKSYGMIDGQVGVALVLNAYAFFSGDLAIKAEAAVITEKIFTNYGMVGSSLLYGKWGLLWLLETLVQNNIIEDSAEGANIVREIARDYMYFMSDAPVSINYADDIYSQGICVLKQYKNDGSLSSYFLNERIIAFIDECEIILTQHIPYIHDPFELSSGYIISVINFLKRSRDFYPSKVDSLLEMIRNDIGFRIPLMNEVEYKMLQLLGYDLAVVQNGKYCLEYAVIAGIYSLIYEKAELFDSYLCLFKDDVFADLNSSHNVSILLGLAFGVIAHLLQYN